MHRLTTTFVLGYHGCDEAVAERLISGEPFQKSINDYDWLGPGIYFWEANPLRGLEFAAELQNAPWGSDITTPAVVGAIIDLGFCLDLTTAAGIRQVRAAHASYISNCEQTGDVIPQNSADAIIFVVSWIARYSRSYIKFAKMTKISHRHRARGLRGRRAGL